MVIISRSSLTISPPLPRSLTLELRAVKRADRVDSGFIKKLYNNDYTSCFGDGIWLCRCGHENILTHWTGPHPFKFLRCGNCDRVIDAKSLASDILKPVKPFTRMYSIARRPIPETMAFGMACPDCGLTHRGRVQTCWSSVTREVGYVVCLRDTVCVCGRAADSKWLQFRIGDAETYRMDPHGTAVDLKMRLLGVASPVAGNATTVRPILVPKPDLEAFGLWLEWSVGYSSGREATRFSRY
ncbi:hypothetical protein BDV95DRAFT_614839 [Massariosphaeria phaeospora]|uniref:Probable double zinc ribbon domain-containing protein n=1 Tax=Massariosphaeria phaeospora TaxID=100035 RepID=A0A7C8ML44_9PLEO|nr:hypothetical protein BDV95DRAFT_614839 [Massariosphaeria phaeospora]